MSQGGPGKRRGLVRDLEIAFEQGSAAVIDWVRLNSDENSNGCWIWRHTKGNKGYGAIVDPRRPFDRASPPRANVHRIACEAVHGPMGEDWTKCQTRHKCDNPTCVNPDHLEPGTPKDNSDDKMRRNRFKPLKGVINGRAKITDDDVRAIRRMKARYMDHDKVGAQFGISGSMVTKIIRRTNWSHIP